MKYKTLTITIELYGDKQSDIDNFSTDLIKNITKKNHGPLSFPKDVPTQVTQDGSSQASCLRL
jgi:hypothetical protein